MNICLQSDDNYVMLLEVVMVSIMENNKKLDQIVFHIFSDNICEKKQNRIREIVQNYSRDVFIYNINKTIDDLRDSLDNEWAKNNSYAAYARLFMPELIPNVREYLYLDCDTLVTSDISDIFDDDLGTNIIAAVKDVLPYTYKKWFGNSDGLYINSGIMRIDAEKWRNENITNKIVDYIYNHCNDSFPDQDAINYVLRGRIKAVDPKYCVFYPEYSWKGNCQLKGYLGKKETYYSEEELEAAGDKPSIIHYTDTIIGRPWQKNNINPYSKQWLYYFHLLPKEHQEEFKEKQLSSKAKVFRFLYQFLPQCLFAQIYYSKRNQSIQKRIGE